jgi:hypothetical protein
MKHSRQTLEFIYNLKTLGRIYGFIPITEYPLTQKNRASADLAFKLTEDGAPVIIFEIESRRNANMSQNAGKVFTSRTEDTKKPWFFFHIVYVGDAGCYSSTLDEFKSHRNYQLCEKISTPENKRQFLKDLHGCILKNFGLQENVWTRFSDIMPVISDPIVHDAVLELFVNSLNLPLETQNFVNSHKLTIDHARKLLDLNGIMVQSPESFISAYMVRVSTEAVKNNWSVEKLADVLDNVKFNYILNRSRLYYMNVTHEKNMAEKGTCFCLDIRRTKYAKEGKTQEEIKAIIESTKRWGKEDHIHAICLEDLDSENFHIYFSVTDLYGIHHSDLEKLKPTFEEYDWLIMKNLKWSTNDKGLCWNCGQQAFEVQMNGVMYCRKCAHEIIDERAAGFKSNDHI